ncbi:3'5'-cyclic nucleotide phosphodiesterase [Pelomyxa schiedti]|nr:3'5'-cyclic nucleotide phosphodiesterase [Pelomyxa schiedti]
MLAQTLAQASLLSHSLSDLYDAVLITLKTTSGTLTEQYKIGWATTSEASISTLTYITPELAAAMGFPGIYGFLADVRPDRHSEFYVEPYLLTPEPVTPGEICECANEEWELFCNRTFPGQSVCTPCENFCEIRDGLAQTKLLDMVAPAFFNIFPEASAFYIQRNPITYDWGRHDSFYSFHKPNNLITDGTALAGCPVWYLCDPTTNPDRTVAFSPPMRDPMTGVLIVSVGYPSYYEDYFIAGCYVDVSMEETVTLLEEHTYNEGQFAMLVNYAGEILGGSQLGFYTLFGGEFNKSSDVYNFNSSAASQFNTVTGTTWGKVIIGGVPFLFFNESVASTPWFMVLFEPEEAFSVNKNTWKVVIGVALPILFITGIIVLAIWTLLLRTRAKVQDLETQMGLINAPAQDLMGTPAELVVQKLLAVNKHTKLNTEDHTTLSEVIGLVASNKLYKADYISKKQMGLISLDTEVDHFLTTTLLRYNSDERELNEEPGKTPISTSLSSHSIGREPSKELKQVDQNGKLLKLDSWDFNVLGIQQPPPRTFCLVVMEIIEQYGLCEKLLIEREKVENFLNKISLGYFDNPYHCVLHAADVAQALHIFLRALGLGMFTDLEVFAGVIACAVHDYKHPGVNNNFLQTTFDRIAVRYNGVSILENMHVAEAFKLLIGSPETNFMASWDKAQQIEFHRLVTTLVLSTDMSKHVELLGQFKAKVASGGKMDFTKKADRELTLQLFIKFADVNNASRCWPIASVWAQRIMEEFFRQGDEEKRRNLPVSPFMDRSSNKIPKCQSAFIEFVITPFATVFVAVVPSLEGSILSNVRNNLSIWARAPSTTPQIPCANS